MKLINRILVNYGGDFAISAYGILNRIMMFAMMPGIVIGQGLQPILGFNYGAKRYGRALKAIKIATIAATVISSVVFLILYFFPEPFIRIFTNDDVLISVSSHGSKYIWLALYLTGFSMVGSMVFQAIGKPIQSFVTAISRHVLFLIPLILLLPQFFQLDGIWLAFPTTDVLAFVLVIVLLMPQIKILRRMDISAKMNTDVQMK